jgi:hypothetical protein
MAQIEFPTIPHDHKSESMLQSLKVLSGIIMDNAPTQYQSDAAAFLYMLGSAPRENDYLYFKVHQGTEQIRNDYKEWYNKTIHSGGQEHMLKVLTANIGDFHNYFNQFQMAFYIINEHAKTDPNWQPLQDIIWGFYCSLFDSTKRLEFIQAIKDTITSYIASEGVIIADPEEAVEGFPYFGQAGEA